MAGGGSYLSAEQQSVYFVSLANCANLRFDFFGCFFLKSFFFVTVIYYQVFQSNTNNMLDIIFSSSSLEN